jgi:SPP1 family predicted phage head-tail adaptor
MATDCICARELNKRIELQKVAESADSGGFGDATPTWSHFRNASAKIETTGAREFYRASQTFSQMTHLLTIRYLKGLTTKHRVKYGTRIFGITGIINVNEDNRWLRLACLEAADGVQS